MLTREEAIVKYPRLRVGMEVYNPEGDKLGIIISLGEDFITIEKGFFFPKDFTIRYDDIEKYDDLGIVINQHREDLKEWKDKNYKGWEQYDTVNSGEEKSIPVSEERLEVLKEKHPSEIRVRKIVHTEMKQFTVPVTREEVIIEHHPVTENKEPEKGTELFKEKETRIPVYEEEVIVTKRPVTNEEIRLKKEHITEQQNVKAEVRKEEVKIEKTKEEEKRKAA